MSGYHIPVTFDRSGWENEQRPDHEVFAYWIEQVLVAAFSDGVDYRTQLQISRILFKLTRLRSEESFLSLEPADWELIRDCLKRLHVPVSVNRVITQLYEKFDISL